jgi:hypothetical protein
MTDHTGVPTRFPRTSLGGEHGPRCRTITPGSPRGWSEPVIHEWELRAETWTDCHPHTEYNFVIEGVLFVESGGTTVQATAGDLVRVPQGATARYWAPQYARLLSIYGPSDGAPSAVLHYGKLTSA